MVSTASTLVGCSCSDGTSITAGHIRGEVLVVVVAIWPVITPFDPNALTDDQFQPPSAQHWFGTDVHGRDVLTRVLYGAQISLLVGIGSIYLSPDDVRQLKSMCCN